MSKKPPGHPYNIGRWPEQDCPLIDTRQLKYASEHWNELWRRSIAKSRREKREKDTQ